MKWARYDLSPPSLEDVARVLSRALPSNYATSSATVVECPDLRDEPFKMACEGLSGSEAAADIGGQGNLFPQPRLDKQYSLIDCAKIMGFSAERGFIIGAGAGPFHIHGTNSELAPHFSWQDGFDHIKNLTRSARFINAPDEPGLIGCPESGTTDFCLMMNIFGSLGLPGPVIKVTARGRRGDVGSFTDFIRRSLTEAYGKTRQVSLGGVFIMKSGKAKFHIMPPFPPQDQLPFKSQEALDSWLSYYNFSGPMVCLSVLHSADPQGVGIRLEHTHCFSHEKQEGGHYHYDLPGGDESE